MGAITRWGLKLENCGLEAIGMVVVVGICIDIESPIGGFWSIRGSA